MTTTTTRSRWILAALAAVVIASVTFSEPARSRPPRKTHVVAPGESVARIADYYGVSQRDLREMNGLRKGRPLRVGQKLCIPNVLRVPGKRDRKSTRLNSSHYS